MYSSIEYQVQTGKNSTTSNSIQFQNLACPLLTCPQGSQGYQKIWDTEYDFDTSRSAKCHRQAAVGHWISLCVKCCRVVDSVPIKHTISIL